MRYFISKTDNDIALFETDADMTKYRFVRRKSLDKNAWADNHTDFNDSDWVPIKDKEYFTSFREEISDVDVFISIL